MSDRRYIPLSSGDDRQPDELGKLKFFVVYAALLNCYAHEKFVEKAEIVMQKIRDMGFAKKPL
jgi:pentatricopeptide repeat protein